MYLLYFLPDLGALARGLAGGDDRLGPNGGGPFNAAAALGSLGVGMPGPLGGPPPYQDAQPPQQAQQSRDRRTPQVRHMGHGEAFRLAPLGAGLGRGSIV